MGAPRENPERPAAKLLTLASIHGIDAMPDSRARRENPIIYGRFWVITEGLTAAALECRKRIRWPPSDIIPAEEGRSANSAILRGGIRLGP